MIPIWNMPDSRAYVLIAGLVLLSALVAYQQPEPTRLALEDLPTFPTAEGTEIFEYASYVSGLPRVAEVGVSRAPTPVEQPSATPTETPTETPTTAPSPEPSPTATPSPLPSPTFPSAPAAPPKSLRVPILMYHYVGDLPANADIYRRDLTVSPANFEAQLKFLQGRGYTSISLDDLLAALEGKQGLPPKPVVFTFDDGYKDNFQNAFPLLQRYGFTGTLFIITDYVGRGPYLSWDDIRAMQEAGMSIESHGRAHLDLSKLSAQGVADQAEGSAQAIEANTGKRPRYYAYPSGRYNQDVIRIIRDRGYLAAVTTRYGSDHNQSGLMELKRVRVSGGDGLAAFASKIGERL